MLSNLRDAALAAALAGGLLLLPTSVGAVENDAQLWAIFNLNHDFNERWGAHLETRVRVDDDISSAKDFLIRPFVAWTALDSLALDLGYDYLHSFQSGSEHRIWEAAEHQLSWRDFTVQNRLRLGQRFVQNVSGVIVRLRYRLRVTHPFAGRDWYGVVSNETFANLNDRGSGPVSGFEQNRLRLGVGFGFLKRLRAEVAYEWQVQENRGVPTSFNHVVVLAFSTESGRHLRLPWVRR